MSGFYVGDIDISFDENAILQKYKKNLGFAQMQLKQDIANDSAQFVPLQSGMLRRSTADSLQRNDPYLVYNVPYAHYMYIGLLMVDSVTGSAYSPFGGTKVYKEPPKPLQYSQPGALAQWFEHAKGLHQDKWIRNARRNLTRE